MERQGSEGYFYLPKGGGGARLVFLVTLLCKYFKFEFKKKRKEKTHLKRPHPENRTKNNISIHVPTKTIKHDLHVSYIDHSINTFKVQTI